MAIEVYKQVPPQQVKAGDIILATEFKEFLINEWRICNHKSQIQRSHAFSVKSVEYFGGYYHFWLRDMDDLKTPLVPAIMERTNNPIIIEF